MEPSWLPRLVVASLFTPGCDGNEGPVDVVEDTGTSTSGASTGAGETAAEGSSGSDDALLDDYCTCMLFRCHGHYHERWGDDERVARAACLDEASEVPSLGSSQESGDSLECRLTFCTMSTGEDDPAVCPAAVGESPCES